MTPGRPTLQLVGQRYGRLLVVAQAPTLRYSRWRCLCDCGKTVVVSAQLLRMGTSGTRSCGCLKRETLRRNRQAFAALMGARRPKRQHDGGRTLAEAWR